MKNPIPHRLVQLPAAGLGRCLALASLPALALPGVAFSFPAPQVVTAEVVDVAGPSTGLERFLQIDSDEAGSWVLAAQPTGTSSTVLYGLLASSGTNTPSVLRTPQTLSGYTQESIFSPRVLAGKIAYSAVAPAPSQTFSSWIDDQLIASEGMAIGTTGLEWFGSGTPHLTTGPRSYVRGTALPVGGGSMSTRVVVRYPSETIVLSTGSTLPGLTGPTTSIHTFDTSPSGAWWVAIVSYESMSTGQEEMAIILDGNLYLFPVSFSRAWTELGFWESFQDARVNDDREVTFLGRDFIGDVVSRAGNKAFRGVFNELEDVDEDGFALTRTALPDGFGAELEGLSLSRFGAEGVDANGNGAIDSGWAVARASSARPRTTFLGDGLVLSLVSLQVPGAGVRDAVVLASLALPGNVVCEGVNNGLQTASTLRAVGSNDASFNDLQLRMTSVPGGTTILPLVSSTTGLVLNPAGSFGNLCLGGVIGRGTPFASASDGSATLRVYPNQLPQPTGAVAAQAGQTWYFQVWYRDSQMGMAGSNFSSALGVTFR